VQHFSSQKFSAQGDEKWWAQACAHHSGIDATELFGLVVDAGQNCRQVRHSKFHFRCKHTAHKHDDQQTAKVFKHNTSIVIIKQQQRVFEHNGIEHDLIIKLYKSDKTQQKMKGLNPHILDSNECRTKTHKLLPLVYVSILW
jgi:hypothetical protein